jgi:hypothetical protein
LNTESVASEVVNTPVPSGADSFKLELGVKLAGAELDTLVDGGISPEA